MRHYYDTGNCGYVHRGHHVDDTCPARVLDRPPRAGDTVRLRGGSMFCGCVGVAASAPEHDERGNEYVAVTLPGSNYTTVYPLLRQVEPIEPGPMASYANQAAAVEAAVDEWLGREAARLISDLTSDEK
ncbi:hypothetical protein ACWGPQ_21960 [Saccharomonospora azurea]